MMIPKELREIFIYKLLIMIADTVFSLYTATAVSDLLAKAAAGISGDLWSSVLWLIGISVCYLII